GVHGLLQVRQFTAQLTGPPESPLEQPRLEPAVEVLDAAVELRFPFGDKHRLDAKAQAQSDDPRESACRWTPARQFAGVVDLNLSGRPRSFQHSPRNQSTSSMRREPARRRQTAPSKMSLPTQM